MCGSRASIVADIFQKRNRGPLVTVLREGVEMPAQTPIVFVCRTGRRSRRVAYQLRQNGYANVTILQGGMLSWENAGLLEAIDDFDE